MLADCKVLQGHVPVSCFLPGWCLAKYCGAGVPAKHVKRPRHEPAGKIVGTDKNMRQQKRRRLPAPDDSPVPAKRKKRAAATYEANSHSMRIPRERRKKEFLDYDKL